MRQSLPAFCGGLCRIDIDWQKSLSPCVEETLLQRNMTLRWYLIIMALATVLCWSAFGYIIRTVNPEITNWLGFLLFYLSLFLALIGTMSIIGFIIRFISLKHELAKYSVVVAFRQSFLFAFFIIMVLFLLSHKLFTWLNLIFLIVALSALEFFLLSYRRPISMSNNSDEGDINNKKQQ